MPAFDQGTATLIAAGISAVFSLFCLILTIVADQGRIRLEAKLGLGKDIAQEKRDFLYTQLSEFYDPIFALLSANHRIFEKIGPNADVRQAQAYSESETGGVWSELVRTVILPNNSRVCSIIETKLHLLATDDSIDPYMEFVTHAYAYKVFWKEPYEAYKLFQFPQAFTEHVQSHREILKKQVKQLLGSESKQ
jgi:hypothetical protein